MSRRRTTEWLILVAIAVLAAGLRFYRLDDWPPGLHFDEAFHQVEAVGILDGRRPLYFTENMGMDPLHIYLIAALFRVFGVTHLGGRIVSALAGTLTVPAVWWLAQELFATWERPHRVALGAAASFILATMQWHVTMSRTGIQPVLVPLLAVWTAACLWRGLRTGGLGWFAAAGVFLGLGPYAYSSARMLPLWIAAVALWLILFERPTWRQRWPGLLLTAGVSILVFAPLGIYFVTHWEWFTFRARQVTFYTLGEGSSGPLQTLWQNTARTLAMFSLRGDVEIIRNLPGRPVFDPFQSLLFVLGIGACLWRIRRPAYAALPAWLGIMLLPTVLTEYAPHYGRALGAAPAAAMLAGLGAVVAWQGVARWAARLPRWTAPARTAMALLLACGLVASAIGHGHAYMVRWGSLPALDLPYDVGLLAAARAVRERVPTSQVYLSPIAMGHPILRFMLWDRPGARSYDGRYALVLPPPADRPVDYCIVSSLDERSLPRLQALYPGGEVVDVGGGPADQPYYLVYRVPAGAAAAAAPAHAAPVSWAGQIALRGYDTDREQYRPGDVVALTLHWQSLAPVNVPLTVFTHLLGPVRADTGSPVWAGWDQEPGRASYPTSAWQPGEIILDEYVIQLPPDIPPGAYDLEVGWYHLETMQRLPVSQAGPESGPDYAIIGRIFVVK